MLQFKVGRLDGHSGPARPPAGAQNDPDIFLFRVSANLNFVFFGRELRKFPAKNKFGANRSGNFQIFFLKKCEMAQRSCAVRLVGLLKIIWIGPISDRSKVTC